MKYLNLLSLHTGYSPPHVSYHLEYKIVELDNTQRKKKWSALLQLKRLFFIEPKGEQSSYKNKSNRTPKHACMVMKTNYHTFIF